MRIIGVIGAGECDEKTSATARNVGCRLAEEGCSVVTGAERWERRRLWSLGSEIRERILALREVP